MPTKLTVSQGGEHKTALRILADQFTFGNEDELEENVRQARFTTAFQSGDLRELRYLMEVEGMDVHKVSARR